MKILWDGLFNDTTSLGIVSHHLVAALARRHTVYVLPWPESDARAIPCGAQRYAEENVDFATRLCDPRSCELGLWRVRAGRARAYAPIVYFDEMRLPERFVRTMNERLRGLIVPSRFTGATFIASGLRVPIHVLPFGVAAPAERGAEPSSARLELLCAGYLDRRKGIDVLFRAFERGFGGDTRVHLTVKGVGAPPSELPDIENITYDGERLSREAWFAYLGRFHYFVASSRLESFGLIALEAAASGTAPIYPLASAYAAYAEGLPFAYALARGSFTDSGWEIDDAEFIEVVRHALQTRAFVYDRTSVSLAAREHSWERSAETFERIAEATVRNAT